MSGLEDFQKVTHSFEPFCWWEMADAEPVYQVNPKPSIATLVAKTPDILMDGDGGGGGSG